MTKDNPTVLNAVLQFYVDMENGKEIVSHVALSAFVSMASENVPVYNVGQS
jgi:hypothetical protein